MMGRPGDDPPLPTRGRWLITAGTSLVALPVVFSFFFFGLVAADGAQVGAAAAAPRPLLATALGLCAALMGGGWAGLVPWSLGRPRQIPPTFGLAFILVAGLFSLLAW